MSEQEEDRSDKGLPPTERRLEQARDKGDIPLSPDTVTAAVYLGFWGTSLVFGSAILNGIGGQLATMLAMADRSSLDLFQGSVQSILAPTVGSIAQQLTPWLTLPAMAAILALVAQRAPAFAPSKLAPKLSRLSPLSNAKQKFGASGLIEFLKSFTKLAVMSGLLGVYLARNTAEIVAIASRDTGPALLLVFQLMRGLFLQVALIAVVFAVLDLVWQRLSFDRRNMMSRKEMRDEMKESEGDPTLRQQRRARAVAIATAPLRKAVAGADVVIVNPTHFAVALSWDRGSGRVPHCVAKGVDEIAARIRELAVEAGVPIQSDPPTARALFAEVAVGQEIDRSHYRAVAAAIRFADRIHKMSKAKS